MLETSARPWLQRVLFEPIAKILARFLSANQVTLLSFVSGVLVLPALMYHSYIVATLLILLSGIFDIIDGSIARIRGESSMMGAVYDIMSDRAVEAAIIVGIFLIAPEQRALETVAMLSAVLLCVSSFLLAGIVEEQNAGQKSFHYSVGIMERAEAFIFFTFMIWLGEYFSILAWSFSALVMVTAIIRLREISQALKG